MIDAGSTITKSISLLNMPTKIRFRKDTLGANSNEQVGYYKLKINEQILFDVGGAMPTDSYADTLYWLDGATTTYTVTLYIVNANKLGNDGASGTSTGEIKIRFKITGNNH